MALPKLDATGIVKDVQDGGLFGSTMYQVQYDGPAGSRTALFPSRALRSLNPASRTDYAPCPKCGRRVAVPKRARQMTCRYCSSTLNVHR